jgi:hypothetical protein
MKINFDKVIENESERNYYENLHKKIIDYIASKEGVSFQEIVKNVGGSDRRVLRLLSEMEKNSEIILNEKKIYPKTKTNLIKYDIKCNLCESKIIPISDKLRDIQNLMKDIYSKKPVPTNTLPF